MEAAEIQRGDIFSVTQEVTERESEGYHGEGLMLDRQQESEGKTVNCNLRSERK